MSQPSYKPIYNSSWAVLIGIDEYQDREISPLRGPVSDANAFRDVLVSIYEFPEDHITILTNHQATRDAILNALEQLTDNRVDPDDRILIFFSGHGIVREGKGKTYYLVPTDAELNNWNTFISQEDFLTRPRHIPAKHILFVIDACHSGSFVREPKQVAPDLEEMLTHSAWQAIGASLPDQVALDAGGDRHSLFTEHLLRGLRGEAARPDGILTLSHLAVFVRDNVARINKKQVPIFGFLPHSGPGEFIFHFETKQEIPNEIRKALLSELTGVRVAAVWELETQAMWDDTDISYQSRAKLQEIAINIEEDEMVRLAAEVATRLSIPMIEALSNKWVRGPLFNQSDSSIYDRIVAAIEYDGHNNFHMNNNAISLIKAHGLDIFNDVSPEEKNRFARAIVRSAQCGAFGPQRFLKDAGRIPEAWLSSIVNETANYLINHHVDFWSALSASAIFNPLREWIRRNGDLPDCWVLLIEATLKRMVRQWYRTSSGKARTAMLEIWQTINNEMNRDRLEWVGKNPDLVTDFIKMLQAVEG